MVLIGAALMVAVLDIAAGLSSHTTSHSTNLVALSAPASSSPTSTVAASPTASPSASAVPTPTASPTAPPSTTAPKPAAPPHTTQPKPTTTQRGGGYPTWPGHRPVSGALLNWTIGDSSALRSQSGDQACFTFPVQLDDVNGGSIQAISLSVTWPMPPGQHGTASGSSGSVPVSLQDGQSTTVTVSECLSPVPDVTLYGTDQMYASLTYYGDLANGQSSVFAGYDDFTV
jgi:hypothetical protein